MHLYKKKAFLKFFLMYFLSVALLVLIAGHFYFSQMQAHLLKEEEFSLFEYARHIKMGISLKEFSSEYHHKIVPKDNQHIDIRNFTVTPDKFEKFVPIRHSTNYLKITKSKKTYDAAIWHLREKIITIQLLILLFFAFISYRLAKNALKPLEESIDLLDKFAKDLIHDLNTPVTSIKLNMNILERLPSLKNNKALSRVKKSIQSISELHENLTILLEEKTFQTQTVDVCTIVYEIVEIQKPIYPDIDFIINCTHLKATLNPSAFKQILHNIISNAGRYNTPGGYIKIYTRHNALYIEDSGRGIQNPDKVFERDYSGEHSSGLGLDIVKRLSLAMQMEIKIEPNKPHGTIFILTMR